jgi:hypothetical protein
MLVFPILMCYTHSAFGFIAGFTPLFDPKERRVYRKSGYCFSSRMSRLFQPGRAQSLAALRLGKACGERKAIAGRSF